MNDPKTTIQTPKAGSIVPRLPDDPPPPPPAPPNPEKAKWLALARGIRDRLTADLSLTQEIGHVQRIVEAANGAYALEQAVAQECCP